MSYALDIGLLGSQFCTLHHGFMEEVLRELESRLDRARSWRITCPLGTEVNPATSPAAKDAPEEAGFTLR